MKYVKHYQPTSTLTVSVNAVTLSICSQKSSNRSRKKSNCRSTRSSIAISQTAAQQDKGINRDKSIAKKPSRLVEREGNSSQNMIRSLSAIDTSYLLSQTLRNTSGPKSSFNVSHKFPLDGVSGVFYTGNYIFHNTRKTTQNEG